MVVAVHNVDNCISPVFPGQLGVEEDCASSFANGVTHLLARTVAVLGVGVGSLLEDVVLPVDDIHFFAIILHCLVRA
jgi:hypothetical protein